MRHHHVMHERADLMVLEYLGRVGDLARRRLRSDERLDFMNRLRRRIEETRAVTGAVEPEHVRRIIARFGDPARLVEREAERLKNERAASEPAEPAEPAGLEEGRVASEAPAPEGEPDGDPDGDPPTQPLPVVRESTQPEPTQPAPAEPASTQPAPAQPARTQPARPQAGARTGGGAGPPGRRLRVRAAPRSGVRRPGGAARPGYEGLPTYEETGRAMPGMPGLGETMASIDLRDLVRERRLETAAIALLGLGGLFIPFPYTFVPLIIGAVCLAVSRTWVARDKLIGLLAPVAGLVLGVFVVGAATRSEEVVVDVAAYTGAITGHGMTFVRIGALIGAGYLCFQLLRSTASTSNSE